MLNELFGKFDQIAKVGIAVCFAVGIKAASGEKAFSARWKAVGVSAS